VSDFAVSMMIGTADVARMRRHTFMPSRPGSMRSSSTTSGLKDANAAITASPERTTSAVSPSLSSTIDNISASEASSSTTSTRSRLLRR
jgi:hypothetical protein